MWTSWYTCMYQYWLLAHFCNAMGFDFWPLEAFVVLYSPICRPLLLTKGSLKSTCSWRLNCPSSVLVPALSSSGMWQTVYYQTLGNRFIKLKIILADSFLSRHGKIKSPTQYCFRLVAAASVICRQFCRKTLLWFRLWSTVVLIAGSSRVKLAHH